MAAERELEPAAHRDLVDRGDHRLRRRVQHRDHLAQMRRRRGRRRVELADLGAARERVAGANQQYGFDVRVGVRLRQPVGDPLAHTVSERVYRRVLEGDDGDLAVDGVSGGGHGGFS
jgi:hypothetical protein